MGCGFGPGLRAMPVPGGSEVDTEGGGGGMVGGKSLQEAVSQGWKGAGEGLQPFRRGGSGEMDGIACFVEVAFKGGGIVTSQEERRRGEKEAMGK
jgi:hypothetical protein